MPNQADYDKVNRCLLAPLLVLFNTKQTDDLIEGFVEEFSHYSEETLRAAFKALRRSQKRFPSIAQAIEACEAEKPRAIQTVPQSKDVHRCVGHAEIARPDVARSILESQAGRLSLQLGVARDLMVEYENKGRTEFDEAFVRDRKRHLDEAARKLSDTPEDTPLGAALHSLFRSMIDREKRLFAEFSERGASAA